MDRTQSDLLRYRTGDGRIVEEHTRGEIDGTRYIWFKYEDVPIDEQPPMQMTWAELKQHWKDDGWEQLD